ncbi:MAG: hypothetical protein Q8S02_19805 [Hydrogenophaga sp.]|nr:hypothetical protein [Hydrogenophaga sp.]
MRPPFAPSHLLTLCLCAVAGGCASIDLSPAAAPAAATPTQRALPAWDALATELAERIVNRLSEIPAPAAPTEGAPAATPTLATATFLLNSPSASAFDKAFSTLFGQRLHSLGLGLENQAATGQIDMATQLIERSQRPPLLLVSTQVRANGRLVTSTADLFAVEPADLPLLATPVVAPPAAVKTWRMATP